MSLLIGCACVDPFHGSNLEFTMSDDTQVPGRDSDLLPVPVNTHYSFYGLDLVFAKDENGDPILDDDGDPMVETSYTFHLKDFLVAPVIDLDNPCSIEDAEAPFPGTHIRAVLAKLRSQLDAKYGGTFCAINTDQCPFDPPENVDPGDSIDFLTAQVRNSYLLELESLIKAIVSYEPVTLPTVGPPPPGGDFGSCPALTGGAQVPHPQCIDDESNALRKQVCDDFFADHPDFFVGSDRVLTLPLNGSYFGLVNGSDPRNNQFVGGAAMFVDQNLVGIDGMIMSWQYNCAPADYAADPDGCRPQYPPDLPEQDESPIGFHYMSGRSQNVVRRVINVPIASRVFAVLSGEIAIFPDLGSDDVHF